MGFLQRFLENVFRDGPTAPNPSSFERLNNDDLERHLNVARYGDFTLTAAVRPSFDLQVVPSEGYRHEVYHDEETRSDVPVLMVAASEERVFDLFLDFLTPLGEEVDVVLETSHRREGQGHTDLYREHMDLPVFKSVLWDYEDLLKNDGCTGLAVLNPHAPLEVQFDEHKLLIVYGHDLEPFEEILATYAIPCREQMKFITEAEHVHSSSEHFVQRFGELKLQLGMDFRDADRRGEYQGYSP